MMMPYYDERTETAPRERLEEIQWRKLKALLEAVFASNPFYRRKYTAHGVAPADLRSLGDLEKLPFTTKQEFQEDQERHAPFGSNLSEPLESYVQFHQTTGTTGRPLKWLDTAESWRWRASCIAYALRGAGLTAGDIFLLPFNFGPYTAFWGAYEAAQHLGLLTIPTGGWDTRQRLQCLLENGVTALAITPTYARRMAEVAEEEGINLRDSRVRAIIFAGEPGAMILAIREKIESAWGAKVYEYPGLTEVGTYAFTCEHSERTLALHAIESEFLIEVIDPQTGKAVPEGVVGELVITNLGRACSPAIRFRTGDLVRLKRASCPCGRSFRMLEGGVLGRKDEMLVIRGVNVYPSVIGNIVEKHLAAGERYLVEAFREGGRDELAVTVEKEAVTARQEVFAQDLAEELRRRLNLRLAIRVVPCGTLPRFEYKTKSFVDRR